MMMMMLLMSDQWRCESSRDWFIYADKPYKYSCHSDNLCMWARLKETVLPPCEWRWTVSCHLNS